MEFHNQTNQTRPAAAAYSLQVSLPLAVLVAVMILLIVFGNVLVVLAVFTCRALRAPQNLFLVSLASADILVATLVMPFSLANELMGFWYFGEVWCEIYLALDVLLCTASIAHLCAISLDRYWSVTQAVEYNLKRTPRRIKSVIVVVWVIAAVISCPPLLSMAKESSEDQPVCRINEDKWYVVSSCIGSFFLPCVIMVLVYVRIYHIAKRRTRAPPGDRRARTAEEERRRHQKQNGRRDVELREAAGGGEDQGGGVDPEDKGGGVDPEDQGGGVDPEDKGGGVDPEDSSSSDHKANRRPSAAKAASQRRVGPGGGGGGEAAGPKGRWRGRQNREKRFTFVLAVVMGAFVACWLPFFSTYMLKTLCAACGVPEALFKFSFWFGYCNSALNPVIYTAFNRDFRRSFHRILCRRRAARFA